jgi:DNA-binding transcriptional MerR regulator
MVQQDFPDVTISKIRFLESQGLIAPERTGSGYRKFYDADIERLRWILHQQRDNFLPLKVIKNMLEQGVDQYDPLGAQPTLWSTTTDLDLLDPAAVQELDDEDDLDDDLAPEVTPGDSAAGTAQRQSPAHPAVASATQRPAGSTSAQRSRALLPEARTAQRDAEASAETTTNGEPVTDPTRPAHATPADVVAALQEDPRIKGRSRKAAASSDQSGAAATESDSPEPAKTGRGRPPRKKKPAAADTLLSAEELCALCSISEDLLAGLEQYGLGGYLCSSLCRTWRRAATLAHV